jgi:hypothetical protein
MDQKGNSNIRGIHPERITSRVSERKWSIVLRFALIDRVFSQKYRQSSLQWEERFWGKP